MAQVIKTTFQLRRGKAASWVKNNPILALGEPGFVSDENRFKIGDGVTDWIHLPYMGEGNVVSAAKVTDFPTHGYNWVIYKAEEERKIYQWNEDKKAYEELSFSVEIEEAPETYSIFSKPVGTIVNIGEDEIRIMCPKGTEWHLQNPAEGADASYYYLGVKVYAPSKDIYSFKEDVKNPIVDQTIHYFTNNAYAGIDENGYKYSIIWLAAAQYNEVTGEWTYLGSKSTEKKYLGWDYCVKWYDQSGRMVATNSIRINLSNENCHYINEPYYMGSINVNKLTQTKGDVLVLYGGSATDNI